MSIEFYFGFLVIIAMIFCVLFMKIINSRLIKIELPIGNRAGCIDGARGYLALMVAVHHYYVFYFWIKTGKWLPPEVQYINSLGKVAVSAFFIITGYLFLGKILRDNRLHIKTQWSPLYLSRFLRITPLYLLSVLVTIILTFVLSEGVLYVSFFELFKEVSRWLLYVGYSINGDTDARRITAGVTWTLKYEWVFYLTLPILATLLKERTLAIISLIVGVGISYFNINGFGFESHYLIYFIFGGGIAFVQSLNNKKLSGMMSTSIWSVISILSLVFVIFITPHYSVFLSDILILFFLMPIIFGNSLFGLLKLKSSIRLGEISYSIYLMHGIVFFVIFIFLFDVNKMNGWVEFFIYMPFSLMLVVFFSVYTYQYIEKPFVVLSHIIRKKRINTNETI